MQQEQQPKKNKTRISVQYSTKWHNARCVTSKAKRSRKDDPGKGDQNGRRKGAGKRENRPEKRERQVC